MLTGMKTKVNDWRGYLLTLEKKINNKIDISYDEALNLCKIPDEHLDNLTDLANRVREKFQSNKADLCSIINARSGKCPEDCKFCTQSSHHKTQSDIYPMKSVEEIVAAAKVAEKNGSHRFCIVTSGDELSEKDFEITIEATKQIKETTSLKRCASLGKLNKERAAKLKEAGLDRYHHNVETASSYFENVCSTHTYNEKAKTIEHLKEAEIETCVGGILNLGEDPKQRIEFAFELKKINPPSIPINFLNPRPGTPLENSKPISANEAAKYISIFRLIMPQASIRLAGGRCETFAEDSALPFKAGANALLIGDLLTTKGPKAEEDINLLNSLGFNTSS